MIDSMCSKYPSRKCRKKWLRIPFLFFFFGGGGGLALETAKIFSVLALRHAWKMSQNAQLSEPTVIFVQVVDEYYV